VVGFFTPLDIVIVRKNETSVNEKSIKFTPFLQSKNGGFLPFFKDRRIFFKTTTTKRRKRRRIYGRIGGSSTAARASIRFHQKHRLFSPPHKKRPQAQKQQNTKNTADKRGSKAREQGTPATAGLYSIQSFFL
jgi:hypothetical protein